MSIGPRAAARGYLAVQAVAGAAWWVVVPLSDTVRTATLGPLPPLPVAVLDVPLFVGASALAATGVRRAATVTAGWTVLVTVGLVVLATLTGEAGWGAVAMLGASAGSVGAAFLLHTGRVPVDRLLVGPFAFRSAPAASTARHLRDTLVQLVLFWTGFLVVAPTVLILLERRWAVGLPPAHPADAVLAILGAGLLVAGSTLGLAAARTMARHGRGTPLPGRMATALVDTGPYGRVRNPMAVAGLAQVVGVGLIAGAWSVIGVALVGAVLWHTLVRPAEEADLARRFDPAYTAYRARVGLWVPWWRARVPAGRTP